MLRRRGVNRHDADEAVQETAARAMSGNVDFVDGDDLFRWASVVSWRIAIDARRRCSRISRDAIPDRADHTDVARAAEQRIVLSAVASRFKELSERDRAVLLASFDEQATPTRLEAVRVAVARHRARSRLRGLLDGLAAPVAVFFARRVRWRSAHLESLAAAAMPVVACFALTLASGYAPAPRPIALTVAAKTASTQVANTASVPSAVVAEEVTTRGAYVPTPPQAVAPPRPDASIHVPAGPVPYSVDADVRDKRPSDHLACVTLPSLAGPVVTCVDSPAH